MLFVPDILMIHLGIILGNDMAVAQPTAEL